MSTKVLDIDIQKTTKSNLPHFDPDNIVFGRTFTDHMLIADYVNDEWQDIRIVPTGHLQVHPANATWHYGQSIFEGMKAYKNEKGEAFLFRPEMNARRLNRSAVRMCMPELPVEIFLEGLYTLMSLDKEWIPDRKGSSLYIRPFMMAWDNFLGVRASKTYRFMIMCSPAGMYYAEPVKVKIEQNFTRAAHGGTGMAKAAGNYGGSLYPAKMAAEQGYHQLIWTDAKEHRYVEEAGTMNLMFKIGGKLVTSPLSDTILAGVTRNSVLEIGKSWGMETEERKISVDELIRGLRDGSVEEAFGVGTAATVAQIKSIGRDGVDYDLPPINENSFQVKVNAYLEELRKGHIEDPFNWRVPIQ